MPSSEGAGPRQRDPARLPDQWRGLAIRYEKTTAGDPAGRHIAVFLCSAH
ncbi:hypothetical protein ACIA8I_41010 [Streptomyces rishiriensis]